MRNAQAKGVVIMAAAGNNGPSAAPGYPAMYDVVITVTATDQAGNFYRYANRGSYIMFAAQGVDVGPKGTQSSPVSGTSYAAPVVSVHLAERIAIPGAAAQAAVAAMRQTARDLGPPGRDTIRGFGLIDD